MNENSISHIYVALYEGLPMIMDPVQEISACMLEWTYYIVMDRPICITTVRPMILLELNSWMNPIFIFLNKCLNIISQLSTEEMKL